MDALATYPLQAQFRGSIIKEYLLVVKPEAHIWQQLISQDKDLKNEVTININIQPQITLANFLAKEEMEDTLLRWMYKIISTQQSFNVALNNYSGSPTTNTVFLRIQDHQPFKHLAKQLKVIDELVTSNGLPKAQLTAKPHLAITGKLEPAIYEQLLSFYSKKEFHAEFQVNELLLLKRTHQHDQCQQVNIFRLLP